MAYAAWRRTSPASPFLDREGLRSHVVGPFPHGTRRDSLLKLFADIKWNVRPLQPEPAALQGVWWKIQANAQPATTVLHTQFGEVLLSEVYGRLSPPPSRAPVVVASAAFLKSFQSRASAASKEAIDPRQANDPWASALEASGSSNKSTDWRRVSTQVERNVTSRCSHILEACSGTTAAC